MPNFGNKNLKNSRNSKSTSGQADFWLANPRPKDKLTLVSKVWTDNVADAEKSLAQSLKLLKTDHLDLVHIHHLGDKNLDRVLGPDGVQEYLLKIPN